MSNGLKPLSNFAGNEFVLIFERVKRIGEEAPIIPEKVRAGEQVRESTPIEQYNSVKRSIARAKMSSHYLIGALELMSDSMYVIYIQFLDIIHYCSPKQRFF
jgi:hypothetical protein